MNYVVFDLEWNQPAGEADTVLKPIYLPGEIIEIGAVKLNEKFEIIDEKKIYVLPQFYSKLHNKVASLTHIRKACLEENGKPFPEAYREFISWCGEDFGFMTWSESDMEALIENMLVHHMDVSEFPVCYDVQRIFDREILREERKCSLDKAIEILGEKGDQAHDALHDSRNTVLVINHMDLDEYLPEYGAKIFAEAPGETVYASVEQALQAPEIRQIVCPWCGETMELEEGWLRQNFHRYMGMVSCEDGDEFALYVNFSRSPEGYTVNRILYEMSDDLWDRYQDQIEDRGFVKLEE